MEERVSKNLKTDTIGNRNVSTAHVPRWIAAAAGQVNSWETNLWWLGWQRENGLVARNLPPLRTGSLKKAPVDSRKCEKKFFLA